MLQMCVELLKSRNKMQQVIFPDGNRIYVMTESRVLQRISHKTAGYWLVFAIF